MATLKIPKKEVEKHIKLSPENIDKIMLMGIPISVQGEEVEIEITPNRPDLLSIQGFLRAVNSYFKPSGIQKYRVHPPESDFKVKIESSVAAVRPYTACAIVKKLKFDDEKIKTLIDMQEKLHGTIGRNRKKAAIGIYPLEKIALPITYEAKKPSEIKFRPLESEKEMTGSDILKQHPTGKEYARLLESCSTFPIFKDVKGNVLSMPPIINSHETGRITEQTTDVFIECSGSDLEVLKKILNIIVTTLADMGGQVYAMDLDYGKNCKVTTPDLKPEKIKVSLDNTNKLLGLSLKEKDLEKLLPKMGYGYEKGRAAVPAWRTDILHEVDIIEDIAIAYGYDNLVPEIPEVATIGSESPESKIERKIAEILIGLGLIETSSYHLIKNEEAERAKIEDNKIEVADSKTEYKILRPNILIPTLRIFAENKDNEYPQKLFEIGTVFAKSAAKEALETGIKETQNLLIACSPGNFTELKEVLDYLTRMLGTSYTLKEAEKEGFVEGRTGAIIMNNKQIGTIGELHPETLRDWNIKIPIAVLELSLDEIFSNFSKKSKNL